MSVTLYSTGPSLTVELGIAGGATGAGVWGTSLWDTGTWGPDVTWTDVSAYVQGVYTFRGRSRESDRYQAGTMSVTLKNTDARFTPGNLSGPYVSSGVTQLRPRVPIRVKATYNAIVYNLFYGFVSSWQDNFPNNATNAITTVTAVDPLSLLSSFNAAAVVAVGAGDTAGARLQRILSNVGWTLGTDLDTGSATMQATTLAANAFTEAALTSDSEGGALWCEPDGTITFDSRTALIDNTRSNTSQVAFATTGGAAVDFQNPVVLYDDTALYNIIRYARVGSTEISAYDSDSRSLYGDLPYARNDLICETDAQVTTLVASDLQKYRNPEYRVVSVDVYPHRNPSVYWPHALGRRIRDRATVAVPIQVAAITINKNVFIDGITHQIDLNRWVTTFSFASATAFDGYSASLFDTGLFDSAVFFV